MPDEQSQSRRFDDMRKQIDGIASKQDSTSRNVYKILALLEGDDFAGGMVSAVKDHEIRISKLEKIKDKTTWVIMGMSIPTGYGIIEIAKKFWPQIIGGLAILLLFTGCITQQRREDIFHRHAREYRADILPYCPPPTTKVVKGEPDTVTVVVTEKVPVIHAGDTVWLDCPDHEVRYILQTDTITETDVAPFEAERLKRIELERHLAVSEARREDAVKQSMVRLYWIIGLSVALGLAVVVRVKGLLT